VLVTSAGPGDGKTTVTALLARSLANCGRRVLLVDADLRNPSVAGLLNLDNQRGLMDVLVGPEPQHDRYILRTDVERLSVLPTGNVNGQADPELIANGRFSAAIDHWREHFDVVLLDSPPVLPVADARILACAADGAILVVRAHQNQREEVIEAVRHLDAAGGKLWGTVLIRTGSRYYGYSSKYTYGYGARA
jgi:capsular exopolysaccharide synthesis family protein